MKLNVYVPHNATIPLLGIYPSEFKTYASIPPQHIHTHNVNYLIDYVNAHSGNRKKQTAVDSCYKWINLEFILGKEVSLKRLHTKL